MTLCPYCGVAVPENTTQCPTCARVLSTPPAVPAETAPAGTGAAAPVAYASLGDRLLATIVDGLFSFAAFWAVGMGLAPHVGGMTPSGFTLQGKPALLVMAVTLVLVFAYYVCFEWWFGATLGKIVAGVKVTSVDGGRLDVGRSLARNLLRIVDGVGVYLVGAVTMLISKRKQRLGDMMAHTVVIKRNYAGPARASALLGLVVLLAGTIIGSLMMRRAPAAQGGNAPTSASMAPGPSTGPSSANRASTPAASAAGPGAPAASITSGTLALSNLRLAAGNEGPERPNATFRPGESTALLFELTGFGIDQTGKARLKISMTGLDPFGSPINRDPGTEVQPPASEGARIKPWSQVSLPEFALPGAYQLQLTVADLVNNKLVSTTVPFIVEGLPYEPSDTLTLRNFRLTEGKEGPIRTGASYRQGGEVWMAFDVVGFKVGPNGAVSVQEDLEMTAATGTEITKGRIFDINQNYEYVPRRFPATNHLTLGSTPPGEYQMRLTFTDGVGNQRYERVERFTIQP